jgi:cystinosin
MELLNASSWALSSASEPHYSHALALVSAVCGWVYFLAWSLSFYPQVIDNFRLRSVVGLSFDFLALNISGYICYSCFNCSLLWSKELQRLYFIRNPNAKQIPVKLNDVFFSLHGFVLTFITILQCCFFQRANQKVSKIATGITVVGWTSAVVMVIVAGTKTVTWLTMVYYLSYMKFAVTFIKYVPQAWLNWHRKCTKGWSIGMVLLDLAGGLLSLFQMIIDGINYDNWVDFWGDPVKVGLSLLTLFFDCLFLIQHYCLYHNSAPPEPVARHPPSSDPEVATLLTLPN